MTLETLVYAMASNPEAIKEAKAHAVYHFGVGARWPEALVILAKQVLDALPVATKDSNV